MTVVRLIGSAFVFAAVIAVMIGLLVPYAPGLQEALGLRPALGPRAQGAFKDPNVYSPFLGAAFILVLNHFLTRRSSLLSIAVLSLFAVGILSAFSRGGYVNLLVSLAAFVTVHVLLVNRAEWLMRGAIILIVMAATVIPILFLYVESMGLEQFFFQRFRLQSYDEGRFSTHIAALFTFGENPLGIGPGQSEYVFPISPHNLYLRIAVENGIVGIVGWLLFLLTTLWICLEGVARRGPLRDTYAVCFAILIGILVQSLVIDTLHWRHLFLFLAIPIGLTRYERRRARPAVSVAVAAARS
jgi:O-antigen ligase